MTQEPQNDPQEAQSESQESQSDPGAIWEGFPRHLQATRRDRDAPNSNRRRGRVAPEQGYRLALRLACFLSLPRDRARKLWKNARETHETFQLQTPGERAQRASKGPTRTQLTTSRGHRRTTAGTGKQLAQSPSHRRETQLAPPPSHRRDRKTACTTAKPPASIGQQLHERLQAQLFLTPLSVSL